MRDTSTALRFAVTAICALEQDIELRFIENSKPDQNIYIERFNRTFGRKS